MPEPRIVLYATPDCPHCAAARDALGAAGESFEERDPSTSAEVLSELLSFAASAVVPTIVVGGMALVGFDEDRLADMLREPPTQPGDAEGYTEEELDARGRGPAAATVGLRSTQVLRNDRDTLEKGLALRGRSVTIAQTGCTFPVPSC